MPVDAHQQVSYLEQIDQLISNRRNNRRNISLESVLERIFDIAYTSINVPLNQGFGFIGIYDREGHPVMLVRRGDTSSRSFIDAPPFSRGIVGNVIATKQFEVYGDVNDRRRGTKNYYSANRNVRAEIAVPIIVRGTAIGVINLEHQRANVYSERDIPWLLLLASKAADVVEDDQHAKDIIDDPRLAQIVAHATSELLQTIDAEQPKKAIDGLLDNIIKLTNIISFPANRTTGIIEPVDAVAAFIRLDSDNNQLVSSYARRRMGEFPCESIELGAWNLDKGLTGRVVKRGVSEYSQNRHATTSGDHIINEQWVIEELAICITVPHTERVVGVLNVGVGHYDRKEHPHHIEKSVMHATRVLADNIAVVLDNWRLSDKNSREAAELKQITDISRDIEGQRFEEAAVAVLTVAKALLPSIQQGFIFTAEPSTIVLRASLQSLDNRIGQSYPIASTIPGRSANQEHHPVFVGDVSKQADKNQDLAANGAELALRLEQVGVLDLYCEHAEDFPLERREKLHLLAQVAANTLVAILQPEKRVQLANRLTQVARNVSQRTLGDKSSLLQEILDAVRVLVGTGTYCSILTLREDDNGRRLYMEKHTAPIPREHESMSADEGVCGEAIQLGRTVYAPVVKENPHYRDIKEGSGSELVVPFWQDEKIGGVINIEDRNIYAFGNPEGPEGRPAIAEALENFAALVAEVLSANTQYRELTDIIKDITHQLSHTPAPLLDGLAHLQHQIANASQTTLKTIDRLKNSVHFVDLGVRRLKGVLSYDIKEERFDLRDETRTIMEYFRDGTGWDNSRTASRTFVSQASSRPIEVEMVRNELTTILAELLYNATKYSYPNSQIMLTIIQNDPTFALITCSNASKIALPENLEVIFDENERGHATSDIPGSGRGLHFARQMVRKWGGTIRAEKWSSPGAVAGQIGLNVIVKVPLNR